MESKNKTLVIEIWAFGHTNKKENKCIIQIYILSQLDNVSHKENKY